MNNTVRVGAVRVHRKTTACRGCGKPILWAKTQEGKRIPLDWRAPVYHMLDETDNPLIEITTTAAVSHWATCPEVYKPKGTRAWEQPNSAQPSQNNA